jgi:hypothetical protein
MMSDPPDQVVERFCRPWKVAIKTLLKTHLPPIAATFVHDPQGKEQAETLGVPFFLDGVSIAPDDLVAKVLENPNQFAYQGKHYDNVEGIKAARQLYSKMSTLRNLLKRHPDPHRVPMYNGISTSKPWPEDQELNDLLKETATLEKMHPKDYMILMHPIPPSTVEWPHANQNSLYLFDDDDLYYCFEDKIKKGEA